jgi:hypothetical protein
MYVRITRSGSRSYLRIVEGFRDEHGKVRQRIIANLGRIDQLKPESLDTVIKGLQRVAGKPQDPGTPPEFESALAFGDLWALHCLWEQLGLGDALRRALRSSRRQFDAEALIRTMAFNRLCDPESKLGVLRWLETVVIPKGPKNPNHDQLLRAMDTLMDHLEPVEQAICGQLRPLLDQTVSVVFYDLTTIRVSGESVLEKDLRQFGRSKDGGTRRQFVLGVVQSADGLPLMHTVHEGNIAEVKTLRGMVQRVLERFRLQRIVIVADRGLLSLDNLDQIESLARETACVVDFILAVPVRRYGELGDRILQVDANRGPGEISFSPKESSESPRYRLIVDYDEQAAAHQRETRRAKLDELLQAGQQLADKLDRQDAGQRQKGRKATDRGAYMRFYRQVADASMLSFIEIDLEADRFSFAENEKALKRAQTMDGKLVLITSIRDLPAGQVVSRYKALADIERGFRVLKSAIEIAPVYHRLPDRIRAHALICFLALVLHRILRQRLQAGGSAASPDRALQILRQIQRHSARIDGHRYTGTTRPNPEQMDLFKILEIPPPKSPK